MKRATALRSVLGFAAAFAAAGCTVDQPSRWPKEQWQELHGQLETEIVRAHRNPAEGRCGAGRTDLPAPAGAQPDRAGKPQASGARAAAGATGPDPSADVGRADRGEPASEGAPVAGGPPDRLRDFDKTWKHDLPWPPVGDHPDEIGPIDDFLIALGYAYLTGREANPRRAFVVFAEHHHRFPRSPRGKIGAVHAQLTIGDLTSAEAALAELAGRRARGEEAPETGGGSTGTDAQAAELRQVVQAMADSEAHRDSPLFLPLPDPAQETDFVRWLVGYLNCRPSADGIAFDRGPEKKGADDLAGSPRPANFLGMEQLKEPPRPGPLSYIGFVLTPVTFFGERFIDLVERDDLPRLPRWPDLGVLPGRDRPAGALPRTWYVADFMRRQATGPVERDRSWKDRSARFLACTLRPRWAGQWVPRLHDAPDLGYFPGYPAVYATLGRLSLAQEPGGRPTLDDLCDAMVALLLSSHQEPRDPVAASELCWLWYSAQQRDDPALARRQPFLDPQHRFGERVAGWAAELVLKGDLPAPADATVRNRELLPVLARAGAIAPAPPFHEDGSLTVAAFRVLAAILYQLAPELRDPRAAAPLTRRAQDLLKSLVLQGLSRADASGVAAVSFEAGDARQDPWRLTPRGVPAARDADALPSRRAPLEPWHDPVFGEQRALLDSWLGALEAEYRADPRVLARCAQVRDRLWR